MKQCPKVPCDDQWGQRHAALCRRPPALGGAEKPHSPIRLLFKMPLRSRRQRQRQKRVKLSDVVDRPAPPKLLGEGRKARGGVLEYDSFQVADEVFSTGDCACLKNPDADSDPFVCRIERIFRPAGKRAEPQITVRWFYRFADTALRPDELEKHEEGWCTPCECTSGVPASDAMSLGLFSHAMLNVGQLKPGSPEVPGVDRCPGMPGRQQHPYRTPTDILLGPGPSLCPLYSTPLFRLQMSSSSHTAWTTTI